MSLSWTELKTSQKHVLCAKSMGLHCITISRNNITQALIFGGSHIYVLQASRIMSSAKDSTGTAVTVVLRNRSSHNRSRIACILMVVVSLEYAVDINGRHCATTLRHITFELMRLWPCPSCSCPCAVVTNPSAVRSCSMHCIAAWFWCKQRRRFRCAGLGECSAWLPSTS